MRKAANCICKNKGADQLRSNCEADQLLCFRYMESTIPKNWQPLAIFCACTARFVSDLVGNPNCWFSHTMAHMALSCIFQLQKRAEQMKKSLEQQEKEIEDKWKQFELEKKQWEEQTGYSNSLENVKE